MRHQSAALPRHLPPSAGTGQSQRGASASPHTMRSAGHPILCRPSHTQLRQAPSAASRPPTPCTRLLALEHSPRSNCRGRRRRAPSEYRHSASAACPRSPRRRIQSHIGKYRWRARRCTRRARCSWPRSPTQPPAGSRRCGCRCGTARRPRSSCAHKTRRGSRARTLLPRSLPHSPTSHAGVSRVPAGLRALSKMDGTWVAVAKAALQAAAVPATLHRARHVEIRAHQRQRAVVGIPSPVAHAGAIRLARPVPRAVARAAHRLDIQVAGFSAPACMLVVSSRSRCRGILRPRITGRAGG